MRKEKKLVRRSLFSPRKYLIFFVMLCFVITCCMVLFLNDLEIDIRHNRWSAISTFLNIILLSLIFTILDGLYQRFMVERPLNQLLQATQKIIHGDFSVRIPRQRRSIARNEMDVIIDNFNDMAKELAGVETLRSDFIANVSHELKTPLSIIKNHADLLQSSDLSETERIAYAKVISTTAYSLSQLITNILRLNKLENQNIYLKGETYDLGEQLAECLLRFEQIWEDRQIDLETDIEEGLTITADSELLALVWNNLFSNAFKFTEANGSVRVQALRQDKKIIVSITDTGCGMDPETGAHIFEKFYQGDTSHAATGNGLGLALEQSGTLLLAGIALGLPGLIGMLLTYPLYVCLERRGREKIAERILAISDELLHETKRN